MKEPDLRISEACDMFLTGITEREIKIVSYQLHLSD